MKELSKNMSQAMDKMLKAFYHVGEKHLFHFGQLPYAKFKPKASGKKMFNQPANVFLVTMPTPALEAKGKPFISKFGVNMGLSSGSSRLTGTARWGQTDARRTVATPKRGYTTRVDFTPGTACIVLPFHGPESPERL